MNDSRRRQIGRIKHQLRQLQAEIWSEKQEECRYRDWLEIEEEDNPGSEEYQRADESCGFLEQALEEIESAIGNLDELLKPWIRKTDEE